MIIVLLIIAAVAAFICFIYIKQPVISYSLTGIFIVTLLASLVLIVENDRNHFGMQKVTETTTTGLASASDSKTAKVLLYQSVGTADKHRVYIYKKDTDQKKVGHTQTNIKTNNRVKTIADTPRVDTKTTRWQYKSGAAKFWFGLANNDKQLIKRTNTFYVNKTWLVLSTTQAKQLAKLIKTEQPKLKTQAKAYVTAQVKAAMMKNPTMPATKRAALAKQAAAQYQAQAMAKIIQQVKESK